MCLRSLLATAREHLHFTCSTDASPWVAPRAPHPYISNVVPPWLLAEACMQRHDDAQPHGDWHRRTATRNTATSIPTGATRRWDHAALATAILRDVVAIIMANSFFIHCGIGFSFVTGLYFHVLRFSFVTGLYFTKTVECSQRMPPGRMGQTLLTPTCSNASAENQVGPSIFLRNESAITDPNASTEDPVMPLELFSSPSL